MIDLFAGPGGLGEGFSQYPNGGHRGFRIALSIENDPFAHRTLTLRAFAAPTFLNRRWSLFWFHLGLNRLRPNSKLHAQGGG